MKLNYYKGSYTNKTLKKNKNYEYVWDHKSRKFCSICNSHICKAYEGPRKLDGIKSLKKAKGFMKDKLCYLE